MENALIISVILVSAAIIITWLTVRAFYTKNVVVVQDQLKQKEQFITVNAAGKILGRCNHDKKQSLYKIFLQRLRSTV